VAGIAHNHVNGTPALGNGGEKKPLQPKNISSELKALPQWVNHAEDKAPIDPKTGGAASSTNPATWSTFDVAWDRCATGKAAGIGFVLTENDPYTAVDLDHCRDPQTGKVFEWAQTAVDELNSYTEVSPSGTGFHLFVRGKKPAGSKCRKEMGQGIGGNARIEAYEEERYMTVTGHHVAGTPTTIEGRQAELDAFCGQYLEKEEDEPEVDLPAPPPSGLSDDEVIARLGQIPKSKDLFEGHWLSYFGSPSEADLSLCNHIARHVGNDPVQIERIFDMSGLDREKWATREDYRTRTIKKALKWAARTDVFANFYEATVETKDSFGKVVKKSVKVGLPANKISDRLLQVTGGFPKARGEKLFFRGKDGAPLWVKKTATLFAHIGRFYQGTDRNRVRWATEGSMADMLPREHFHEHLLKEVEQYDAVELFPHWPPVPGHYYAHQPVPAATGKALDGLVNRFCPATDHDGTLIRAFFLTLLWGGPGGSRPAFLFTGADGDEQAGRGVGKTTVVRLGSRLVGGFLSWRRKEKIQDFMKRVLSEQALDKRIIFIDNVKESGLSWAELEELITNDRVSGHEMYEGEGQRLNLFTVALTGNGASLSKDLAKRFVIVKLKRPPYKPSWEKETAAYIDEHRWEIIADILSELQEPALSSLSECSRWAAWEEAVLARQPDAQTCQDLIRQRQDDVDDDQLEADLVREEFVERLGKDADHAVVFIPSKIAAFILNMVETKARSTSAATRYLRNLAIPELTPHREARKRGWIWRGKQSAPGQEPVGFTL
jgi:hypothetical protein